MKRRDRDSPTPSSAPANPYREDCWTDGETSALIDAWGERYLKLNRGNFGHNDWEDMAAAVNSRGCRRPPRTGLQCKNRIGTLKKRYKAEKSSAFGSRWPFYSRLDALIGSPSAAQKPSASPPPAALLPSASQKNYLMAAAAAAAAAEEGSSDSSVWSRPPRKRRTPRRFEDGKDGGEGIWLVAQAIIAFTDIYETAARENMRRDVELQKKRMEFDTMLELKRMKMFSDFMNQCQK